MSDFLSNFTKGNYDKKQEEKENKKNLSQPVAPVEEPANNDEIAKMSTEETTATVKNDEEQDTKVQDTKAQDTVEASEKKPKEQEVTPKTRRSAKEEPPTHVTEDGTVTDPHYKKKQQKKWALIIAGSLVILSVLGFTYYRMTTVKVPDFVDKNVNEVREWGIENGVKVVPEQVYNFEAEVNEIIKQSQTAGKRMPKKEKLVVEASMGPDPEQKIVLPKFDEMTQEQAQDWIKAEKAENVTLREEYSDKVEKNHWIKQAFSQKDFDEKNYTREDQLILTYSKGKEVFEKNIEMPDFKGKAKGTEEEWVKKNEIKVTYEYEDSEKAKDLIIGQSVEPKVKVAKRDKLTFKVSKGKAVVVPNFSDYNKESAASFEELNVNVKENFSDSLPYGSLISQSVEVGKKYYEGEVPEVVTVVYSAGRPYLRSYMGELEGDLAQKFYDDYKAKGANILYTTYRMPSDEPKGTVVKMSTYNEFVPMNFTVSIGISSGVSP